MIIEGFKMKRMVYRISSITKILSTILISLILSGCIGGVNMAPSLTNETILEPEQGLIVARVINASGSSIPFNQLTITPENLNESKQIKEQRLTARDLQVNGSTVFAAAVPVGNYALSSIRAFYFSDSYSYSRFASTDIKFGTFEIKPGEITDLGTIIYYPKSQGDKYTDMLLRVPSSEENEILNKYYDFYSGNKSNILGWHTDEYEEERESTYISVLQNPVAYEHRYVAPDKSIYFLSKLGVIIKRSSTGEWVLDAVDTNLELSSIAQNKNGDVIVGAGEGKIFWKRSTDEDWQDISFDHNYQIEELIFHDEKTVDMIARNGPKLTIFRRDMSILGTDWKVVNHYTVLDGWKSLQVEEETEEDKVVIPVVTQNQKRPETISNINLYEVGNKHYLTVRSFPEYLNPIFAAHSSRTFIYNPDTWEMQELAFQPKIFNVLDAGAIKLGIKKASFWSFSLKPSYLRYDKKLDEWKKISTFIYTCNDEITREKICTIDETKSKSEKFSFSFMSIPWFKNELEALAIVQFKKKEGSERVKIMTTDDGGSNWSYSKYNPPAKYCYSIVPEISDRLVVSCNGVSGDFYESTDEGANWQHVREHENF